MVSGSAESFAGAQGRHHRSEATRCARGCAQPGESPGPTARQTPGPERVDGLARCQRGTAKQRCDLVHLTEGASGSAWRLARELNTAASRGCRLPVAAGVAA